MDGSLLIFLGKLDVVFFFFCLFFIPWRKVVLLWREGEGVYWFGGRGGGGVHRFGGGGGGGGKLPLHPHPLTGLIPVDSPGWNYF